GGRVRAVALGSTDGLRRGMDAVDTGESVTVPVGKETLGRVFNLLGEPIDKRGPVDVHERRPIHREPPEFADLTPKAEVAQIGTTGKHVIDQTVMVFGQMNEPPGARLRVALSALTMAEYFRDDTGADTLLFIDNIFRFTQAGSEVSALLGRMPSAVGYQPTL